MTPSDGWNEWSKHVLAELERLNECYRSLREEVIQVRIEVTGLRVKAGIWGAAGALVPVIIGTAVAIGVFIHGDH